MKNVVSDLPGKGFHFCFVKLQSVALVSKGQERGGVGWGVSLLELVFLLLFLIACLFGFRRLSAPIAPEGFGLLGLERLRVRVLEGLWKGCCWNTTWAFFAPQGGGGHSYSLDSSVAQGFHCWSFETWAERHLGRLGVLPWVILWQTTS